MSALNATTFIRTVKNIVKKDSKHKQLNTIQWYHCVVSGILSNEQTQSNV